MSWSMVKIILSTLIYIIVYIAATKYGETKGVANLYIRILDKKRVLINGELYVKDSDIRSAVGGLLK